MKLVRCNNQHLFPIDVYSSCPYCNKENVSVSDTVQRSRLNRRIKVEYGSIPEAGPSAYTDRLVGRAEKEAIARRMGNDGYDNGERKLHVNTKSENAAAWFRKYFGWIAVIIGALWSIAKLIPNDEEDHFKI